MYYKYIAALFIGCSMSFGALCMEMCDTDEFSSSKERTFLDGVIDGAVAGGVEVAFNNPWVALKNELILSKEGNEANTSMIKQLYAQLSDPKKMIRKYYKGCGMGIASMAPITALQNSIAFLIAKSFGSDPTLAEKTIAAFGAGCLSASLASPADLVVLQRQNPSFASENLFGTLRRIYKVNGFATVYRGVTGTGARDGIFTVAYKTGGDVINTIVPSITGNVAVDKAFYASFAGVIAAILSHPADVITARMKNDLTASEYTTSIQTARTLIKEEGMRALFKGLTPRAFRIILAIPLLSAMIEHEVGTRAIHSIMEE